MRKRIDASGKCRHLGASRMLSMLPVVAASILAACGGGGGSSGGGGGGSDHPTLSYSPNSLAFTAAVNDPLIENAQVHISYANIPANAQTIKVGFSNDGVKDVSAEFTSATTVLLTVVLRSPASLRPAAYTDQIQFTLCSDSACAQEVSGTGGALAVSYTVTPPAAGNEPALSFAQNAITVQGLAADPGLPAAVTDALTLSHLSNPPFLSVNNTGTASVTGQANAGTTSGSLTIQPGSPAQFGAGSLVTPLQITACLDETCANPIPGSPFTVMVTYQIGNSVSGPDPYGYTLTAAQQNLRTMVWDPVHSSVYTLLPIGLGTVASVAPYDPTTETIGTATDIAANGTGALAVSDDGQFLYVGVTDGTIQRFTLPSLTLDAVIALGNDGSGNPYYANAIQVAPASAHTIAVSESLFMFAQNHGGEAGVAIFDDGVQRVNRADGSAAQNTGVVADDIAWSADGSSVFATGNAVPGVFTLVVDAQGVASISNSGAFAGSAMHRIGSTLYLDAGQVVDTQTGQVTTPFAAIGTVETVLPDPADSRIFVAGAIDPINGQQVYAFDLSTGAMLSSFRLPPLFSSSAQSISWILARGGTLPAPLIVINVPSYIGILDGAFIAQ